MKTRVLALLLFVLALPLLAQPGKGQRGNSSRLLDNLPIEPLSAEEEKSLYLMREEEKLARDVYHSLFARWNLPVFQNIAASEQRHTDQIKMLLDRYGLKDPFIDQHGLFTDAHLQELYSALVEKGSISQLDALKVGATIEDLDIQDLITLLEKVDNQDIRQVYENLTKGSRNHMRSFYRLIVAAGGSYSAQYISQETLDEIISSPIENGPTGNSQGRNGRNRGGRQGDDTGREGTKSIRVGNYPNPANPATTIVYQLEEPGMVELAIYNSTGQLVRSAVLGSQSTGEQRYLWDARDDFGHPVASGLYFCRVSTGDAATVHRMLLMR
ncbi:MAG TPA: DUF2202 domain-containing protein [bacterium]|nr:DUF2202 domain-containing protein [bacterium]